MYFLELILIGLTQLRANAMRSFLTILGIMIGVGAVVGVVSIGEGLRQTVVGQIAQVGGARLIFVQPPASGERRGGRWVPRAWREYLTEADRRAFEEEVDGIDTVIPLTARQTRARHRKASSDAGLYGTVPGYERAMGWEVAKGRFLTERDVRNWSRVCVIGGEVKEDLFGPKEAVGEEIKLGKDRYSVVGVMKVRTSMGRSQGDQIFVPVTTIQKRLTGVDRYDVVYIYAEEASDVPKVTAGIKNVLKRRHRHGSEFRTNTGEDVLQRVETMTTILKMVGGGIAAISLLVGGIGIMNIMLVSVTERTREIGIRKALGARRRHILTQFIIESVVLSIFGGLLGIVCGLSLGLGLAALIQHNTPMEFPSVVSPAAMALAILFSAGIGIFFGVYPAARAARLDPVDALRYE